MSFDRSDKSNIPAGVTELGIETINLDPQRCEGSEDGRPVAELAAAIKRRGTVEPVVVRPVGNVYELVAGERRFRAARLAGFKKIPAIIRDLNQNELAAMVLVESLSYAGLNVIEEAKGYRRLADEFGITQSEIGRLVGKGQSTIANKLRLLKLPETVQTKVLEDGVSERHARALLDLDDERLQLSVLKQIREKSLSVRDTEERVSSLSRGDGAGAPGLPGAGSANQEPSGDTRQRRRTGPQRRGGGQTAGPRKDDLFGPYPGVGNAGRPNPNVRLSQVSDRRAIRVFRDVRLFLNTFNRAVEMLKEAGILAEMSVSDGPEFLEVRVVIPKGGSGGAPVSPEGRG